jgi:hypothetical protein
MNNESLSVRDLLELSTVPDEDTGRTVKLYDAVEKTMKKARQKTYQFNGKSEVTIKLTLEPDKKNRNSANWRVDIGSKLPKPSNKGMDVHLSDKAEIHFDDPNQQKLGGVVELATGKSVEK